MSVNTSRDWTRPICLATADQPFHSVRSIGLSPCRRTVAEGILAIEEDSLPELEIEKEPQAIGVPADAGAMVLHEPPQRGRHEQSARQCPRPEDELLDEGAEGAPEPGIERHGESHLSARENLGRHEVADGFPEHQLRTPSAELEASRYRRRVVDERSIEEGHPALDRRRHAHLVLLHQEL